MRIHWPYQPSIVCYRISDEQNFCVRGKFRQWNDGRIIEVLATVKYTEYLLRGGHKRQLYGWKHGMHSSSRTAELPVIEDLERPHRGAITSSKTQKHFIFFERSKNSVEDLWRTSSRTKHLFEDWVEARRGLKSSSKNQKGLEAQKIVEDSKTPREFKMTW